jgi:hypothetical protein
VSFQGEGSQITVFNKNAQPDAIFEKLKGQTHEHTLMRFSLNVMRYLMRFLMQFWFCLILNNKAELHHPQN